MPPHHSTACYDSEGDDEHRNDNNRSLNCDPLLFVTVDGSKVKSPSDHRLTTLLSALPYSSMIHLEDDSSSNTHINTCNTRNGRNRRNIRQQTQQHERQG